MYETPFVNVKVERGLTFTFTQDLPYITSIYARKMYARMRVKISRQWKSIFQDFQ